MQIPKKITERFGDGVGYDWAFGREYQSKVRLGTEHNYRSMHTAFHWCWTGYEWLRSCDPLWRLHDWSAEDDCSSCRYWGKSLASYGHSHLCSPPEFPSPTTDLSSLSSKWELWYWLVSLQYYQTSFKDWCFDGVGLILALFTTHSCLLFITPQSPQALNRVLAPWGLSAKF